MTTAGSKIELSTSQNIPFNKLVLSELNVRRTHAGASIEQLADDISRRGLLQSLHVRAVVDADGNPTGIYEVLAGGRRFRALQLLVKRKRLGKTALVPCVVGGADRTILAEDDSLAENVERAPLHVVDQYRAFKALLDKGMSAAAIAAAFFVDERIVKQRLRLASVSPTILDLFVEGTIDHDLLMAFTVNPDHSRQEQVWDAIRTMQYPQTWKIKQLLTEASVAASDRRALFVGVDVYEAAGGPVNRDLFTEDNGGWLADPVLLDRLVTEKLERAAADVAGEGWKWTDARQELPYGFSNGLRRLEARSALTNEDQARRDALMDEYSQLSEDYIGYDVLPSDVDTRMGEIEKDLDCLDSLAAQFEPGDIAIAGAFVTIGSNGVLLVHRGFVRPEDEPASPAEEPTDEATEPDHLAAEDELAVDQGGTEDVVGAAAEPDDPDDDASVIKPLPERLMMELTAHRTLALRAALALNPRVAMTALLHTIVRGAFDHRSYGGCLQASVRTTYLAAQPPGLSEAPSATSIDERSRAWEPEIPEDDHALWDWLDRLDETSRMALLAHCISFGVNAQWEKPSLYGSFTNRSLKARLSDADRLAQATGLDMVEAGWRPTVDNYLGRVTKGRILQAVREGAGEREAEMIAHLKKADMAREAERLLADTGWLPELLRTPGMDDAGVAAGELTALPNFLEDITTDDLGDADEIGTENDLSIAAE